MAAAGRARARRWSSTSARACSTRPRPWLAGGPPAWLAGEPAARQTLGRRRRPGHLLGRQAARRAAGGHHRRPGRPGRRLRPPPAEPGPAPGRAGAGRPAGRRRWPTCAATATPSRSGAWPPSPVDGAARPGPRRSAWARSSTRVAVAGGGSVPGARDPVGRRRRRRRPRRRACGPHDPPVIARVHDGRTVLRPAHRRPGRRRRAWPRRSPRR